MQTTTLADLELRLEAARLGDCSDRTLSELIRELHRGRRKIDGYLARIATEARRREDGGAGPAADELFGRSPEVSRHEARRQAGHGRLAADFPQTAAKMHGGGVLPENLDTMAGLTRGLTEEERKRLGALDGEIAQRAGGLPPETFGRWLRKRIRAVTDNDRPSTAEQQKAAASVTMGRRRDGMWWISGAFDPERGAVLDAMIRRTARGLAGSRTPTDNTRADALHQLATRPGSPAGTGRSGIGYGSGAGGAGAGYAASHGDAVVAGHEPSMDTPPASLGIGYLVDLETLTNGPHDGSVAQTWAGDDHDPRAVQRLACDADSYAVLIDRLGRLDAVGITRRAASREQRLALRALYRCCPLDGTAFDRCEVHHVNVPFELGGRTAFDNLIPISSDWHHRIHDRGWMLTMADDRTLTLRRPNGELDRIVPPPRPLTRQRE